MTVSPRAKISRQINAIVLGAAARSAENGPPLGWGRADGIMQTKRRDDRTRPPRGPVRWLVAAVVLTSVASVQAGTIALPAARPSHVTLADHPAFAGVGMVDMQTPAGDRFVASGTLIGSQYLVTAAHVVDRAAELSFNIGGRTYEAQRWAIHPRWYGNFNNGTDIAIVRLTQPVTGVTLAPLHRRQRELGKVATIVGYGRGGTGRNGATLTSGTKLAGQNRIDLFSGSRDRLMLTDFDNPATTAHALPLEFQPAPGDSGGGLFIGTQLAGVVSFLSATDGITDAGFGDTASYVRISQHLAMIDQALLDLANPHRYRRKKDPKLLPIGQPGQPIFSDPVVFPLATALPLSAAAVPEPASLAMWSFAAIMLAARPPWHRRVRT